MASESSGAKSSRTTTRSPLVSSPRTRCLPTGRMSRRRPRGRFRPTPATSTRGFDARWSEIHLGRPAEAAADFREALNQEADSAAIRLGLFLAVAERAGATHANPIWKTLVNDNDEARSDRWNTISVHLTRLTESRPECWWFWRARGHAQDETRASRPSRGGL